MNTYQFAFNGRARCYDADTIFEAMVMFHALYAGTSLDNIEHLVITKFP